MKRTASLSFCAQITLYLIFIKNLVLIGFDLDSQRIFKGVCGGGGVIFMNVRVILRVIFNITSNWITNMKYFQPGGSQSPPGYVPGAYHLKGLNVCVHSCCVLCVHLCVEGHSYIHSRFPKIVAKAKLTQQKNVTSFNKL